MDFKLTRLHVVVMWELLVGGSPSCSIAALLCLALPLHLGLRCRLYQLLVRDTWWSLQFVANKHTPADGINVSRLAIQPLIILIGPTIKVYLEQTTNNSCHGCHTHQSWIHEISAFKAHARLKAMIGHHAMEQMLTSCQSARVAQIALPSEGPSIVAIGRCHGYII